MKMTISEILILQTRSFFDFQRTNTSHGCPDRIKNADSLDPGSGLGHHGPMVWASMIHRIWHEEGKNGSNVRVGLDRSLDFCFFFFGKLYSKSSKL